MLDFYFFLKGTFTHFLQEKKVIPERLEAKALLASISSFLSLNHLQEYVNKAKALRTWQGCTINLIPIKKEKQKEPKLSNLKRAITPTPPAPLLLPQKKGYSCQFSFFFFFFNVNFRTFYSKEDIKYSTS